MNELEVLVSTLNNYADTNNWNFGHGQTYFINQKINEGDVPSDSQVQLFLFELSPIVSTSNTSIEMDSFRMEFFIGMKSKPDEDYYKSNNGVSGTNYRFDKYFVPLYDNLKTLLKTLNFCKI